jgi:hypothetical protein
MMRRSVIAILLLLMPVGALAAEATSLGGPFRLIDQNGAVRTEADFRGSYPLV